LKQENSRDAQKLPSQSASQISAAYQTAHEVLASALYLGFLIWVGYKADEKFVGLPVFTFCGACLGFIAAGFSLRRILQRLDKETASRRRK